MFIHSLFEKENKKETSKDELYKSTQHAAVRQGIDQYRKEFPGANDIEAAIGHAFLQDKTNQEQEREIDQLEKQERSLRKQQDALVKDLQDKERRFQDQERRFQDFNKAVAAMDLTPPEQARAAQQFTQEPEKPVDVSKVKKPSYNTKTGTPAAPMNIAPTTPTKPGATPAAVAKSATTAKTNAVAEPTPGVAEPATSPALSQMATQLTNVPTTGAPSNVIPLRPLNKLAQRAGINLDDEEARAVGQNESVTNNPADTLATGRRNFQNFVKIGIKLGYAPTGFVFQYNDGRKIPLSPVDYAKLADILDEMDDIGLAQVQRVLSQFDTTIKWLDGNGIKPVILPRDSQPINPPEQVELPLQGEMPFNEGGMSEMDAQYYDFLNSRGRNAMTDSQFKQAYGMSRIAWAKRNQHWINQKEAQPAKPDNYLFRENSWNDGTNDWSSEHDLWAKESAERPTARKRWLAAAEKRLQQQKQDELEYQRKTGPDFEKEFAKWQQEVHGKKTESSNDFMAVDSTSPVGGKTNENEVTVANQPIKAEQGYFGIYTRKPGTDKWAPITKYPSSKEAEEIAQQLRKQGYEVIVREGLKDPKDNPCWKGYKPVGTKKKNGKTVPNCVPATESKNYWEKLKEERNSRLNTLVDELKTSIK